MDDLFKIFPDLPWLPGKAAADRIREVREREARIRRIRAGVAKNAARFQAVMRRRRRRQDL